MWRVNLNVLVWSDKLSLPFSKESLRINTEYFKISFLWNMKTMFYGEKLSWRYFMNKLQYYAICRLTTFWYFSFTNKQLANILSSALVPSCFCCNISNTVWAKIKINKNCCFILQNMNGLFSIKKTFYAYSDLSILQNQLVWKKYSTLFWKHAPQKNTNTVVPISSLFPNGIFSNNWKRSNLPKKILKNLAGNDRSISLLSNISKIMKKCKNEKHIYFLEQNYLIHNR